MTTQTHAAGDGAPDHRRPMPRSLALLLRRIYAENVAFREAVREVGARERAAQQDGPAEGGGTGARRHD